MDKPRPHTELSNSGLVGNQATFTVPPGYARRMFDVGFSGHGDTGLLFRGFTLDFTGPKSLPRPVRVLVDDRIDIRDVLGTGNSGTVRVGVTSTS